MTRQPGREEPAVAGAVVLEGLAGAVAGEPVELGYELVVCPAEVGFLAVQGCVDQRCRQVVGIEEGDEVAFQLAAGLGRLASGSQGADAAVVPCSG